jgi:hypothetical protein
MARLVHDAGPSQVSPAQTGRKGVLSNMSSRDTARRNTDPGLPEFGDGNESELSELESEQEDWVMVKSPN